MENNNQSSEVKTKNITFGLVVSWIFGVIIGVVGIFTLFSEPIPGILFVLSALIALPPVNRVVKEKMNFSLSGGLKFVVVLVLLGIAGSQMGDTAKTEVAQTSNQEEKKIEVPVATLKVTATQISEDYKANEVAADVKYKGKTVEISGLVGDIGKDILDTPYVTFQTEQYAIVNQVQCMFSKTDEQKLTNLSKGQKITLTGEVSGKLVSVIVKGCEIVE